jgi:hypothetical protein
LIVIGSAVFVVAVSGIWARPEVFSKIGGFAAHGYRFVKVPIRAGRTSRRNTRSPTARAKFNGVL